MQGKTYLRGELNKVVDNVGLTDGGTTANRRIDWGIEKTHSNDGIVITGLRPDRLDLYEYTIKPLRKKRRCELNISLEIAHGDRVYYTPRGKSRVECYVTSIRKTGKLKGYYKIRDFNGNYYGPVSCSSLKKVARDRGIIIT